MPGLTFCQKLPGFLVRESDIAEAAERQQGNIARRIISLQEVCIKVPKDLGLQLCKRNCIVLALILDP